MPRFFVLGSAGWVPTLARQTCAHLLETRRGLILFDCGTGIARLHDPLFREMLRRHRRVLVLLSHWHHDHVEGLHALPFFFDSHEVILAAPGPGITGYRAEEVLERFGGKPLLPHPFTEWAARFPRGFSVVDLAPGANDVAGERVDVLPQPHSDPSAGLRVRDVCYVTDTCARDESVAFAARARLLVHDAWLDREGALAQPDAARVHSTAEGAARVAAGAGAAALLLTHLNPAYDAARLDRLLIEAASVFPRVQLASDMLHLRVEAPEEDGIQAVPETPSGPGS